MYTKQSPELFTRSPISPLLRPHSENVIYDIRSTESSATYLLDPGIRSSRSRYLICTICQRVFQSKAGLVNHERSHLRDKLKQKRLTKHKSVKPRVYTCKECDEEFSQRGLLNKHVKTHVNMIICSTCHRSFKDRMEYDLHDAIYDGQHYDSLSFPAYRTRSQSRLSCHSVQANRPTTSLDSTYANGRRTSTSLFNPEISRNSPRSSSRLSTSSQRNSKVSDWVRSNSYFSENDFNDTASVYSEINNRAVSPASSIASSLYTKASFVQTKYNCSESTCMKTFPTLNWVTLHEMKEHKKLPLFRCNECRKRFTTRGNLRMHRITTHPDVLICVLCDIPQKGVGTIEDHVHLHTKYAVQCDVCSKYFLSKYYLDEHLKHKPDKHKRYRKTRGAILIRIDRRETKDCVDLSEHSTKLPDTIKIFDNSDNCADSDLKDNARMDHLPWRS